MAYELEIFEENYGSNVEYINFGISLEEIETKAKKWPFDVFINQKEKPDCRFSINVPVLNYTVPNDLVISENKGYLLYMASDTSFLSWGFTVYFNSEVFIEFGLNAGGDPFDYFEKGLNPENLKLFLPDDVAENLFDLLRIENINEDNFEDLETEFHKVLKTDGIQSPNWIIGEYQDYLSAYSEEEQKETPFSHKIIKNG